MTSESDDVDFHQKFPVIRTIEEINNAKDKSSSTVKIKKGLSIPICDITIDQDYDKHVKANFTLPCSYLKYSKKLGDEVNITIDYNIDQDDEIWIRSQITDGAYKDLKKIFTFDAFEAIINILERYTGFSKDPIPQINAQKVVIEKLGWDAQLISRILPQVYQYWLMKRLKIGKPLCRRFWPLVPSSDSNPHQVFRTRDKERYKLRKRQKHNDIESFRKMQQLKKEFSKARDIFQFILNREKLSEDLFDTQREFFNELVKEISEKGTPQAAEDTGFKVEDYLKDYEDTIALSDLSESEYKRLMDLKILGSENDGDINDNNEKLCGNKRKKSSRVKDKPFSDLEFNPIPISASTAVDQNKLNTVEAALQSETVETKQLSAVDTKLTLEAPNVLFDHMEPSPEISWPSILSDSGLREKIPILQSATEYMEDLELKFNFNDPSTLSQPQKYGWWNKKPQNNNLDVVLPDSVKFRFRVGRGNRLVMDRVPVYEEEINKNLVDEEIEQSEEKINYIYPTSLCPKYPKNSYTLIEGLNQTSTLTNPSLNLVNIGGNKNSKKGKNMKNMKNVGKQGSNKNSKNSKNRNNSNVEENNDDTQLSAEDSFFCSSSMPLLPLSNQQILTNYALKNSRTASTYVYPAFSGFSGLNPTNKAPHGTRQYPPVPTVPCLLPVTPLPITQEKRVRLAEIMAESDSEDERVVVPKFKLGSEIERALSLRPLTSANAHLKIRHSLRL